MTCSRLWILIFLLAAAIWSVDITRPVDLPNWHEFDYSSIARNFLREGNNILFPRIDWRGQGPGFTEMEFPLIPWIMAQLYRLFGIHEIIGRLLSLLFALTSLWAFRRIAEKVITPAAALIAALFFVVNHEMTIIATAIQPESLMLLCCLAAVYWFLDWYDTKRWSSYTCAIAFFALAMLIKSPAAHLAILFFLWALFKDRFQAFRRPSLYLFAFLAFAPALLWYAHTASLWHEFHNSMGVSNEDHWLGLDILHRPKLIANLIAIDLVYVFGVGGLLAILASPWKRERFALAWSFAVGIYLIVIARTSGANWAAYYHIAALPPVALLFGVAVSRVRSTARDTLKTVSLPIVLLTVVLFWIGRTNNRLPSVFQDFASVHNSLSVVLVLEVLAFLVTVLCLAWNSNSNTKMIVIGCFTYFVVSFSLLTATWNTWSHRTLEFQAATGFRDKMPLAGLIVASGGICADQGGHRVAKDAPDMFYWLDRKGFTTCAGQEDMDELRAFEKRGARYFVADKATLPPGRESQLRAVFPLLAGTKSALLFSLE